MPTARRAGSVRHAVVLASLAIDFVYRGSLLDPSASVLLGPIPATRSYLDSSQPPAGIYCHLLLAYDSAFGFAGASSFACSLATLKSGAFPADTFSLQPGAGSTPSSPRSAGSCASTGEPSSRRV